MPIVWRGNANYLTKHKLLVVMGDDLQEVVVQGSLSTIDGMWHINLSNENGKYDRIFKNQANSCVVASNENEK